MSVVRQMAIEDYHAHESISSSGLADFADDPLLHYYRRAGVIPPKATTAQMAFGTQVHHAIEHGTEAVAVTVPHYALNAQGHRKGKAYTEWLESQPPGATILKEGEPNPFAFISIHLSKCPSAKPFLETPQAELSIFQQIDGIDVRARIDAISTHGVIGDWKTCRDTSPHKFLADMTKLRYPLRLALYQLAVEAEIGELLPVATIAIRNSAPWDVRVYEINPQWLERGRREVRHLLPQMESYAPSRTLEKPIAILSEPRYHSFQYEDAAE